MLGTTCHTVVVVSCCDGRLTFVDAVNDAENCRRWMILTSVDAVLSLGLRRPLIHTGSNVVTHGRYGVRKVEMIRNKNCQASAYLYPL